MQKIVTGITAVILAISFSAFTAIQEPTNKKAMLTVIWHKYNAAGTAELSPIVSYTGTSAQAKAAFGCSDGNIVICARAYDLDGNQLSMYITKSPQ